MDETERRFREAERQLDESLLRDRAKIIARGIAIAENSARLDHDKNDLLAWGCRFEIRRSRDSGIAKVQVLLTLSKATITTLRVWRRVEIFQPGQDSRWQRTTEATVPLEDVVRAGLAELVGGAIRSGEVAADGAA